MHAESLRDRTQGRWRAILPALGLAESFLSGRNGPCPWCQGKDRWRFINREGSGNWVCNSCGRGDGIMLAERVVGLGFAATAKAIEAVLGDARPDTEPQRPQVSREEMRRIWRAAEPLAGTPGERYFKRRGLAAPKCLRYAPRVWRSPAILAQIAGSDGHCVNLFRTFIDAEGCKAQMAKSKLSMRAPMPGSVAIRLFALDGRTLGVAEGIENALSAALLYSVPVWALTGTEFFGRFALPLGIEEFIIFGDADLNYAGQKAAYAMANRMVENEKIKTSVEIPPILGTDWNDVLLAQKGVTE